MNENEPEQDRYWEHGWDGHELAQMRRMARWPMSEKLAWLEEAHRLVEQLSQQRQAHFYVGEDRSLHFKRIRMHWHSPGPAKSGHYASSS